MMTKIKIVCKGMVECHEAGAGLIWDDCMFLWDASCRDYDWFVVFDDFPNHNIGSIIREIEPLACPPEQTILLTCEPPSIKIYPSPYTRQFGTVLTTHSPQELPHRRYRIGRGLIDWHYGRPMAEVLNQTIFSEKTETISTICSSKLHSHTMHKARFELTKYLSERIPELVWYGNGVKDLAVKADAMDSFKYHIAIENHIENHHWTEKLADSFLALCLPFYAGDPIADECFPKDSFIPIPIDDPEKAYQIISKAIHQNEYEKRLPSIREARRLVIKQYNLYAQIVNVVHEVSQQNSYVPCVHKAVIKGRHTIRKNWWFALVEGYEILKYKIFIKQKSRL